MSSRKKKYVPTLYEYTVTYFELVPVTKVVKAIHSHAAYQQVKDQANNFSEKESCLVKSETGEVDFHEEEDNCGDDDSGVCACCGRYDDEEEDDHEYDRWAGH